MQLAAEQFGSWVGITVLDGGGLRRIDTAGVDDFGAGAGQRPVTALSPAARATLTDVLARPLTLATPVPVDVSEAVGLPAGSGEQTAGYLATRPLGAATSGRAVLTVLAPAAPELEALDEFVGRSARAMSAANVFDERTRLAGTLRQALVPRPLPAIPGVQLGASYRPAQEAWQIGGDFYDVAARAAGGWAFSIGDVCGKGVDAAVLTGQVRQSLRTAALVTDDPAETLRLVNQTLIDDGGGTFVTAIYGVFDVAGDEIRVRMSVGGHPPPLLLHDGEVSAVEARGTLIGMLAEASLTTTAFALGPGDTLVLYTDGAVEARGPGGILGPEALAAELADCTDLPAQTITARLMQFVMEHLQGWPHDDVALLAIKHVPGSAS